MQWNMRQYKRTPSWTCVFAAPPSYGLSVHLQNAGWFQTNMSVSGLNEYSWQMLIDAEL
jgi:hypothetical protein